MNMDLHDRQQAPFVLNCVGQKELRPNTKNRRLSTLDCPFNFSPEAWAGLSSNTDTETPRECPGDDLWVHPNAHHDGLARPHGLAEQTESSKPLTVGKYDETFAGEGLSPRHQDSPSKAVREAFGEASETLACDKPKGQDNVLWGSALPALATVRPVAQGHRL